MRGEKNEDGEEGEALQQTLGMGFLLGQHYYRPTLSPGQQLHFNKGNRSLVQENSREMASSSAPRIEERASLLLSKIRDSMIRGPIHSEGTHCHVLYNRDSEYCVTI